MVKSVNFGAEMLVRILGLGKLFVFFYKVNICVT